MYAIRSYYEDDIVLAELAQNIKHFAKPNAAEDIAKEVINLARKKK